MSRYDGTDDQPQIPPSFDQQGGRINIIPAEVRGFFRRRRDITQIFLLAFFLITPWLKWNGTPLMLLDVVHREFHFFGLHLLAHDTPMIFFIFAILVFGIIFVTAVWGRAFCGWVCPQTVFIDAVFRRIEIWVEGPYLKRRLDARTPMTGTKLARKIIKWFLFFVAASVIAHSFIAFFVGSGPLLEMMARDPRQNWSYFSLISAITLIVLFDFAWFREQFCLIVCPYGRFQSVLLGPQSLNPAYDFQRGEPRRGQVALGETGGDCVNCRRCVEVCPTGIDIRQGLQMECIACTACIDACDEIMVKVKKPTGLIRYMGLNGSSKWTLKSSRALFSLMIVLVCALGLTITLASRKAIDVTVLRGKDNLYQKIDVNGQSLLSNHFRLQIKNQSKKSVRLNLTGQLTSTTNPEALEIATFQNPIQMSIGESRTVHLFIKFPAHWLQEGQAPAELQLESLDQDFPALQRSIHLIGPKETP